MTRFFGLILVVVGLTFVPWVAKAACPALPYTLTNGTTADASQVMADLNSIVSCVNSGASSGLTLISTLTANNSPDLEWDGLTSAYNNYRLICNNIYVSSSSGISGFIMQYGEGTGPTWITSSYHFGYIYNSDGTSGGTTTPAGISSSTSTYIPLGNSQSGGYPTSVDAVLYGLPVSGFYKAVTANLTYFISGTLYHATVSASEQQDSNPITAIRVMMNPGNIAGGSCSLYGMAQ